MGGTWQKPSLSSRLIAAMRGQALFGAGSKRFFPVCFMCISTVRQNAAGRAAKRDQHRVRAVWACKRNFGNHAPMAVVLAGTSTMSFAISRCVFPTTSFDSSANPIGGRVSQGTVKMRFASPSDIRSICLRSPASRAASKGSCVQPPEHSY